MAAGVPYSLKIIRICNMAKLTVNHLKRTSLRAEFEYSNILSVYGTDMFYQFLPEALHPETEPKCQLHLFFSRSFMNNHSKKMHTPPLHAGAGLTFKGH